MRENVEVILDELDLAGPFGSLEALSKLRDALIDEAGPFDEHARYLSGYLVGRENMALPHLGELIASDDAWAMGWAAGRMMAGDKAWITCH